MRIVLLCVLLLILSCQTKKKSGDDNQNQEKAVQKPAIQNIIESTYNYTAYQEKKNVSLDLLWIREDSLKLKMYLQPHNDLTILQKGDSFLYISGDRVFEKPVGAFDQSAITTYKKWMQAYQAPFQLTDYQFKEVADSLQIDADTQLNRSIQLSGKSNFRLFLAPKTDLIKSVVFSDKSNDTYLLFEQYITVQQIPVSMHWSIYEDQIIDQQPESRVEVKKISYPEQLPFEFQVADQAKPIQNK